MMLASSCSTFKEIETDVSDEILSPMEGKVVHQQSLVEACVKISVQVRDPKTYSSLKLKGREVFPAVFDEDVESLLQYRNSQKRTYSAVIKKADRIDMRTALARLREPGVPELERALRFREDLLRMYRNAERFNYSPQVVSSARACAACLEELWALNGLPTRAGASAGCPPAPAPAPAAPALTTAAKMMGGIGPAAAAESAATVAAAKSSETAWGSLGKRKRPGSAQTTTSSAASERSAAAAEEEPAAAAAAAAASFQRKVGGGSNAGDYWEEEEEEETAVAAAAAAAAAAQHAPATPPQPPPAMPAELKAELGTAVEALDGGPAADEVLAIITSDHQSTADGGGCGSAAALRVDSVSGEVEMDFGALSDTALWRIHAVVCREDPSFAHRRRGWAAPAAAASGGGGGSGVGGRWRRAESRDGDASAGFPSYCYHHHSSGEDEEEDGRGEAAIAADWRLFCADEQRAATTTAAGAATGAVAEAADEAAAAPGDDLMEVDDGADLDRLLSDFLVDDPYDDEVAAAVCYNDLPPSRSE